MPKVLLVDDDEQVVRMLVTFLERDGFSVSAASSATAGKAMLVDPVDIVITDLRMETPLAGFEVVRAAGQLKPRPLIVILTAFPVPRADWTDAGADALFVKGTSIFKLPKQLKALLAGRG
jgi:DNA-binding response OmpR family regulator